MVATFYQDSTTPVQYNYAILDSHGSLLVHYLLYPSFQSRNQHALGYMLLTSILVLRYKAQQCNLVLIQSQVDTTRRLGFWVQADPWQLGSPFVESSMNKRRELF